MYLTLPHKKLSITLSLYLLLVSISYSQPLSANDFESPTSINRNLYGFNGGFMMENCGVSDDSTRCDDEDPPQLQTYYLKEACAQIVNELDPQIIRFPGGSIANFYHFNEKGYGFIKDERPSGNLSDYIDEQLLLPVNYIETFADLALQTGSKVIYVMNLLTHYRSNTPNSALNASSSVFQGKLKENLDALNYLTSRGIEVVGVELGNELYAFDPGYTEPSIGKYITMAKVYADSIKIRYPDLKVGIPMQSVTSGTELVSKTWNKKILSSSINFADAYIFHEYEQKVNINCVAQSNKDAYYTCAKEWVDKSLDDFEAIFDNYVTKTSTKPKEFWITEWNMQFSVIDPNAANSFLHAYFLVRSWNKFMDYNKKYPDKITLTNYHNLLSNRYVFPTASLIAPKEGSTKCDPEFIEDTSLIHVDGFVLRAAYYAHTMMSQLLKSENLYIGTTKFKDCDLSVYKTSTGEFEISLINSNGIPNSITYAQMDSIIITTTPNFAFKKLTQLTADQLYSSNGINYFDAQDPNFVASEKLGFIKDATNIDPAVLNLPGYSISVVTIGVRTSLPASITSFNADIQNCQIHLSWTAENDAPNFIYVIEQNDLPIDTINSIGYSSQNQYSTIITPTINGNYNFKVKAYENGILMATSVIQSINFNCLIPSAFSNFEILDNGNCTYTIKWSVSNEISGNSYHLRTLPNGDTASTIYIVDAFQSGTLVNYSFNYTPQEINLYYFQVVQVFNSQFVQATNLLTVTVNCDVFSPSITSFEVIKNSDCSYNLNWSVSNEIIGNNNILKYSIANGSAQNLYTLIASQSSALINYSYTFTPTQNETYSFYVQLINSNVVQYTSNTLNTIVSCNLPPFPILNSFTANMLANCKVALDWNVSNPNSGSTYIVKQKFNNDSFYPIDTIQGSSTVFNVHTEATVSEEGTYSYQIEVYQDNILVTSSSILSQSVTCANAIVTLSVFPSPTFGPFTVGINSNQSLSGNIQVIKINSNGTYGNVLNMINVDVLSGNNNFFYNMNSFNVNVGLYRVIFTYATGSVSKTIIYLG